MAAAAVARPLGQGGAALAHVLRERTGGNPFLVGRAAAAPGRDRRPRRRRRRRGRRRAGRRRRARERALGRRPAAGPPGRAGRARARARGRDRPAGRRWPSSRRVADLGWDDLLSALDTAVAAGLLEERPGPPGRYAFHHPIVRDLLYRRLPAGERARAHRRVGEALEELTGGTGRLGELADHFALAGAPFADRAVGYASLAGEQAARRRTGTRRPPTATARPWPCWSGPAGPGRPGAPRRAAARGQADAWAAAGQARQATEAYLRAAAAARSAGSADGLARAALGLGGPTGFWSVELDQAVPAGLLGEALEAAGPGDSPTRALLLARLAGWRAGRARASEAGAGPSRPGSARRWPWPAASATAGPWSRSWPTRRPPGAASCGRTGRRAALAASAELDRLAAELGDDDLAYQASRARAGALLAAGDLDGRRPADRAGGQGRPGAPPPPPPLAVAAPALGHGHAAGRLPGQRAAGRGRRYELGRRSDRRGRGHGPRRPPGVPALAPGPPRPGRGAPRPPGRPAGLGGRRLADAAAPGLRRPGTGRRRPPAARPGDGRAARRPAEHRRPGRRWSAPAPSSATATPPAGCRPLLEPWAGHHLAAGHTYLGAADHHLGILAATAGRWEDGLGHLQAALAAHERLGARPWQALTAQALRGPAPRPRPARRPGPGGRPRRDRQRPGRPPRHGPARMGPPDPRPP